MQPDPSPFAAEIDDAFPKAIDPFALSLNENPFPPLPAVRSALIRSIYAANRYPEFLPERLRGLIADHVRLARPSRWCWFRCDGRGRCSQALQALTNSR